MLLVVVNPDIHIAHPNSNTINGIAGHNKNGINIYINNNNIPQQTVADKIEGQYDFGLISCTYLLLFFETTSHFIYPNKSKDDFISLFQPCL